MVVCLEQGAGLHIAQLMPLPLSVSCSSEIQIGFTFLVPAHLGSPGKRAVKWVCVWCVSNTNCIEDLCKLSKEYLISLTSKFFLLFLDKIWKLFDISHAFLYQ